MKRLSRNRRLTTGMCATCDDARAARTEHIVWTILQESVPPPSALDNVMLGGAACKESQRRPDTVWVSADRIVHYECDEHSHADREVSCELAKLDNSRNGVHKDDWEKPHIFLRFNPDACDKKQVSLEDRCAILAKRILFYIKTPLKDLPLNRLLPNVEYLFYHSKGEKHIKAAQHCPNIHVLPTPPSRVV